MKKLKFKTTKLIEVHDWDKLVEDTYGRPYSFQQQGGCKSRGTFELEIPSDGHDYKNTTIPEVVNGDEMGVSFEAWKARDPREWQGKIESPGQSNFYLDLFWSRNFYPCIEVLANDLHEKGLIDAGTYLINIDW
jgi:hypothetical protein